MQSGPELGYEDALCHIRLEMRADPWHRRRALHEERLLSAFSVYWI